MASSTTMSSADKASALNADERMRWSDLSDQKCEALAGRAPRLTPGEKAELGRLTRRMLRG